MDAKSEAQGPEIDICDSDAISFTSGTSAFTRVAAGGKKVAGGGAVNAVKLANTERAGSKPQGKFMNAHGRDAPSDRLGSHSKASTSPRCDYGWFEGEIQSRAAKVVHNLEGFSSNTTMMVEHCMEVRQKAVCHVLGRGGRAIRRIESFCGVFAFLGDSYESSTEIYIWGPPRACAIADFIISALECGHYSIMDSLTRLDP